MADERRDIDFRRLNLLGKVVFLGGMATRAVSSGIDTVIHRVADIVAESEKAFREGSDPNVEDARILDEDKSGKD